MPYDFVIEPQAALLKWAADRITGQDGWASDSEAAGIVDAAGNLHAVAVLNMFHDDGAWVHFATDGRAPLRMLATFGALFAYAFQIRNLRRLTARIAADNVAAQVLALRLGFRVEGREREGFRGQDVAIYAMMRHECTWLVEAED